MLPSKSQYRQPVTIHCPLDHLRMTFDARSGTYRCNLRGCPVGYSLQKGYYRITDEDDPYAREIFCAQSAICLCETDDAHPLYIQDFVANLKIRFWACPVRSCDFEVSQRMEKTQDGWRTCGFFEHSKAVRLRH
jgi:hypothetical protein